MNNREQMLKDIGKVDFVVTDLIQYLDTHPHDRGAQEYFNHYNRIRNQLEKEFAKEYYPLTTKTAGYDREWCWGNEPLPWEGVCG